jgi:hypothetical protein
MEGDPGRVSHPIYPILSAAQTPPELYFMEKNSILFVYSKKRCWFKTMDSATAASHAKQCMHLAAHHITLVSYTVY